MKLSAPRWLALLNAFTSKGDSALRERQADWSTWTLQSPTSTTNVSVSYAAPFATSISTTTTIEITTTEYPLTTLVSTSIYTATNGPSFPPDSSVLSTVDTSSVDGSASTTYLSATYSSTGGNTSSSNSELSIITIPTSTLGIDSTNSASNTDSLTTLVTGSTDSSMVISAASTSTKTLQGTSATSPTDFPETSALTSAITASIISSTDIPTTFAASIPTASLESFPTSSLAISLTTSVNTTISGTGASVQTLTPIFSDSSTTISVISPVSSSATLPSNISSGVLSITGEPGTLPENTFTDRTPITLSPIITPESAATGTSTETPYVPPGPHPFEFSTDTVLVTEATTITVVDSGNHTWTANEVVTTYHPGTPEPSNITVNIFGSPSAITASVPTAVTASMPTRFDCSSPTCTPSPTPLIYTCAIANGILQPFVAIMQTFNCVFGQVCIGEPVRISLNCDCGHPICTTNLPLVPIHIITVPVGTPIPSIVPVPENVPWMTLSPIPTATRTATPVFVTSNRETDSPEVTRSGSLSPSLPIVMSSASYSNYSTSLNSSRDSSTSKDACSLNSFSIPVDFEATLSAWINQFPFTYPTFTLNNSVLSSTASSPSSTSAAHSANSTSPITDLTTRSLKSSSSANSANTSTTRRHSPTPSTKSMQSSIPKTTPHSTTSSCNAACSSSRSASLSSNFESSLSADLSAGHSSFTKSLSSVLASQSVSITSSQHLDAISTCQHYAIPTPYQPTDIPEGIRDTHANNPDDRGYACIADPDKIDKKSYFQWDPAWQYQPFRIDKGWDPQHPLQTLVDTFCDFLQTEKIWVSSDGETQGACQGYDRGLCIKSELGGNCTVWAHNPTTLDNEGPVMIAVTYYRSKDPNICPTGPDDQDVNFALMDSKMCKDKLNKLVNKCSMPEKTKNGSAAEYPVLGGTIWLNCMQFTMVGIKSQYKPEIIWH